MKTKVSDFAEIKSGYLFKEGITPDRDGVVRVIQLKDINETGIIDPSNFQRVDLPRHDSMDFVAKGDVLFKAKTNRPVAAAVSESWVNAIVTAHYFVIRIKDKRLLPQYLAWYLNQRPAQIYFEKYAGGSRVQIINKQTLGDLEVPMLDLQIQEKIGMIYQLHHRERELAEAVHEKRQKLISGQLLELVSSKG